MAPRQVSKQLACENLRKGLAIGQWTLPSGELPGSVRCSHGTLRCTGCDPMLSMLLTRPFRERCLRRSGAASADIGTYSTPAMLFTKWRDAPGLVEAPGFHGCDFLKTL